MISFVQGAEISQSIFFEGSIVCMRNCIMNMLDLNKSSTVIKRFIKEKHFVLSVPIIWKSLVTKRYEQIAQDVHNIGSSEIEYKTEYIAAAKTVSWGMLSVICAIWALAFKIAIVLLPLTN